MESPPNTWAAVTANQRRLKGYNNSSTTGRMDPSLVVGAWRIRRPTAAPSAIVALVTFLGDRSAPPMSYQCSNERVARGISATPRSRRRARVDDRRSTRLRDRPRSRVRRPRQCSSHPPLGRCVGAHRPNRSVSHHRLQHHQAPRTTPPNTSSTPHRHSTSSVGTVCTPPYSAASSSSPRSNSVGHFRIDTTTRIVDRVFLPPPPTV